ncbi:MAG TPA: tetratricopeptide repeat protein [Chryseolinea sp.]|nr:tetratricopeptide repeat protein [Chryseolinea sp.]
MNVFLRKICGFCSLVGVLVILLSIPVSGQKKKKPSDQLQASALRLREAEFYFTEGEKFFILEDYAKALLYYQRTLEINPENATVHYKIAEVLSRSSKTEDHMRAAASIEMALKLEKGNKYFYLMAGSIYTSLAKFDKAAQVYETLISAVKGTEDHLYDLAAIYQYGNKPDEAIKTYNRAEQIFGINEVSSIQKQRLYLEQGKTAEGIAEGEKLIHVFPDEERYIMGFAEVLSQKGLRKEAIQYLEKFSSENPESGNVKMLLAGIYRDNNQEQKARPLLEKLFDDNSVELGSKLIILGTYNVQLNQNKTKKIIDADTENFVFGLLEKLKKSNPSDPNVHIVGGDIYLSTGKIREAQREYSLAVETGDVNFEVWQNLLYLETQLDQFDLAIKHSEQALELYPNQSMLYYFNGYSNLRKHNYEEAVTALDQAKKLSATNPNLVCELNSMLGDAYNATKQYEKSDKAYEDALLIRPNYDAVLNNYSYFLALRKFNLEKAEKMAALLTKNNPENATYLDTFAWVLFTREKYKDAKKIMERAIATGNANAAHFEHYGDILYQLGEVDNAVRQWEKARGLNANSESLNKKIANRKIYE